MKILNTMEVKHDIKKNCQDNQNYDTELQGKITYMINSYCITD